MSLSRMLFGILSSLGHAHLSDFFPGLGWMITRMLWDELRVKWPSGYWDDWMREPAQRKKRLIIRPEISRSATFGSVGSSGGQFWENLSRIRPYDGIFDWKTVDIKALHPVRLVLFVSPFLSHIHRANVLLAFGCLIFLLFM